MRRAHFIVGFNNWGKTTVIFELFDQKKFYYHKSYPIEGVKCKNGFVVQSQSNDDVGDWFVDSIEIRLDKTGKIKPDLVAALCPSIEEWNDFREIIADSVFSDFDEFHFYFLKYKWDHHAELIIDEIKKAIRSTKLKSMFYVIDEGSIPISKRTAEKTRQIIQKMKKIYKK